MNFFGKKSGQLQPITLQNQTIETMHLPELGLSESESYCFFRVRLHWTRKVRDAKIWVESVMFTNTNAFAIAKILSKKSVRTEF